MRKFLLILALFLITGCSTNPSNTVEIEDSAIDYYFTGLFSFNNYGMFTIYDDVLGMSYYDIQTDQVISIPNKTPEYDSSISPFTTPGFTLYNKSLYYLNVATDTVRVYSMNVDGTNVIEEGSYKNDDYQITTSEREIIYHNSKIYFILKLIEPIPNTTETNTYQQIAYFDLESKEFTIIKEPILCSEENNIEIVGVSFDQILYTTDHKTIYNYNIASKTEELIYSGNNIKLGIYGSCSPSIEAKDYKYVFVDNEKEIYVISNDKQNTVTKLLTFDYPIEIRHADHEGFYYTNMTINHWPEDINDQAHAYYSFVENKNYPEHSVGEDSFAVIGHNDKYIFGSTGNPYVSFISREDYHEGNFDALKFIEGYKY